MHRKEVGLPNMEFRMHALGLHVYHPNEPNKYNITFINKVLENIKTFTKMEIKGSNIMRQLYAKLLYPSNTYFRWMIKNNCIKNCGVKVRCIDVAKDILGKDINALKGKTT